MISAYPDSPRTPMYRIIKRGWSKMSIVKSNYLVNLNKWMNEWITEVRKEVRKIKKYRKDK